MNRQKCMIVSTIILQNEDNDPEVVLCFLSSAYIL